MGVSQKKRGKSIADFRKKLYICNVIINFKNDFYYGKQTH